MEQTDCSETSVRDYQNTLYNNPVEISSLLLPGGSVTSCSISDLNIRQCKYVTVHKACLLHLGQSWWWKLQYLGLSKQNGKKESEVRRLSLLKNWTV